MAHGRNVLDPLLYKNKCDSFFMALMLKIRFYYFYSLKKVLLCEREWGERKQARQKET